MRWFKRNFIGFGLFSSLSSDEVHDEVKAAITEEVTDEKWQRLKKMFSYEYGSASPQLVWISEQAVFAFVAGFGIGGIADGRVAHEKFINENMATQFKHHLEAKRALQDTMAKATLKGGFRLGWRLCIVSTSLIAVIMSISTYRGSPSVLDFIGAGSATFGLYKFKHGPKPAISGAAFGAIAGGFIGASILGFMKLTGITIDDILETDAYRIDAYNKWKMSSFNKYREGVSPDYRPSEEDTRKLIAPQTRLQNETEPQNELRTPQQIPIAPTEKSDLQTAAQKAIAK